MGIKKILEITPLSSANWRIKSPLKRGEKEEPRGIPTESGPGNYLD